MFFLIGSLISPGDAGQTVNSVENVVQQRTLEESILQSTTLVRGRETDQQSDRLERQLRPGEPAIGE